MNGSNFHQQDEREKAEIVEESEILWERIKRMREDYQRNLARLLAANAISDEGTLEMWGRLKRDHDLNTGPLWATLAANREELERRAILARQHGHGGGGGAA